MASRKPYSTVLIIPTGIGATIGGYAGDALPVAKAIAQVCDHLITHPNVMNGASLYWWADNIEYVEGYALDKFASGEWGLQPVRQNRIGIIFDQSIEKELLYRHIQVADGIRATLGIEVVDYIITDEAVGVELKIAPSGTSWGTINNQGTLLRAAEKLIREKRVNALAVVARFPDDSGSQTLQNYRYGKGVDALAGAEAIISHLLVRQFQIPCAHSPALSPLPLDINVSPKAVAEELGFTFLPCVLVGLSRAPQYTQSRNPYSFWADDVDSVVIPINACGGSSILSFAAKGALIIAVEENQTVLDVTPEKLGLSVVRVKSYLEAIGVIVAHRGGISLQSLQPNLPSLFHQNP